MTVEGDLQEPRLMVFIILAKLAREDQLLGIAQWVRLHREAPVHLNAHNRGLMSIGSA